MNDNRTVINSDILPPRIDQTVLNSEINSSEPGVGFRFGNNCVIQEKLTEAGEAAVYLCKDTNAKPFVLKYYRSGSSMKEEVSRKLETVKSDCVGKCKRLKPINGHECVAENYYRFGSLEKMKIPYDILRAKIIPQIAEGLKALHEAGIVHKDVKPSNIMRKSAEYDICLIDFGISSAMTEGETLIMTHLGWTPGYAAPELVSGAALVESDYYAFGVTLCALYMGRNPYEGLTQEQLQVFAITNKMPLPDDMPQDLQDLILGLTYKDLSNRDNKANPNRRWTYDEVQKWLRGETQPIPGDPSGAFIEEAVFCGKKYKEINTLIEAMINEWDIGRGMLRSGALARMFHGCSPDKVSLCQQAQKETSLYTASDDLAYFYLLSKLSQKNGRFMFGGRAYEDTVALGVDMLNALRKNAVADITYFYGLLEKKILSAYIKINEIETNPTTIAITDAERYTSSARTMNERRSVLFRLAYILSGRKDLLIGDKEFLTVENLADYLKMLSNQSFDDLSAFMSKLYLSPVALEPQFDAWLIIQGEGERLGKWKTAITG